MKIDLTRPNPARIIDYLLGGVHNFEIDRQTADQMVKAVSTIPVWQRQSRLALQRAVRYMIEDCGLRTLIDFGAGIPTSGNTHLVAHGIDPSVRVLYNDIDPLTSAYGKELLRGVENATYIEGDAQDPLSILESEQAREFLRGERRVGIIYMALGHLMPDDHFHHAAQVLYDWAAPGSCWFVTHAPPEWDTDPDLAQVVEFYRRSRILYYLRSAEQIAQVLLPWQLRENSQSYNLQWGLPDADMHPRSRYDVEMMVYRD
ncbi:MAG: SAM-dependent methyltransferase [Rudaea sp.]